MRGAPIKVKIDAALVLGVGVLEIIGQAGDARKFIPGGRIKICVAATGIDRAVANADIGESGRIILAGGNIAGDVGHEIVDALIPAQRRGRDDVAV